MAGAPTMTQWPDHFYAFVDDLQNLKGLLFSTTDSFILNFLSKYNKNTEYIRVKIDYRKLHGRSADTNEATNGFKSVEDDLQNP